MLRREVLPLREPPEPVRNEGAWSVIVPLVILLFIVGYTVCLLLYGPM